MAKADSFFLTDKNHRDFLPRKTRFICFFSPRKSLRIFTEKKFIHFLPRLITEIFYRKNLINFLKREKPPRRFFTEKNLIYFFTENFYRERFYSFLPRKNWLIFYREKLEKQQKIQILRLSKMNLYEMVLTSTQIRDCLNEEMNPVTKNL